MNVKTKESIFDFFNRFKTEKVSEQDLRDAESKAGYLKEQLENFRLLLRMFRDGISGNYQISRATLAIVGGAIIYVISPIDAIPDFIPGFGWGDDIAMIGFVMHRVRDEIERYKKLMDI